MTGAALREALYLWMRRPREMILANLAAFFALFLPWTLFPLLPPGARLAGLGALGLWSWCLFSALCAASARLDSGAEGPWRGLWPWWKAAWAERLSAFGVGLAGALWAGLAFGFYRALPLPVFPRFALLCLLALFCAWMGAALLFSLGGAATGDRPWRGLWKACALLPPAYGGSALAALGFFAVALVLPASGASFHSWGARFWMAPFLLCPVFTLAFLAAYVTALVRALLRDALGLPALSPPTWRELWTLWR